MWQKIAEEFKNDFNLIATNPLQAFEWGEFREKTGIKVIRRGFFQRERLGNGFQMTIHKIPHTPWTIGYLPRGGMPTKEMIGELQKIGREEKCVFIQLEPYVILRPKAEGSWEEILLSAQNDKIKFVPSARPFFHKYTFIINLTRSEEELLKNMHPKTRYNIKVAQKHGVEVVEDNSDKAFEEYIRLTKETTQRQKFYAHSEKYHRALWKTLKAQNQSKHYSSSDPERTEGESRSLNANSSRLRQASPDSARTINSNFLTAHLLTAKYKGEILAAWILFTFKDTLYYPYGASSNDYKEVMASNLMMWEAIRFGKKSGLKKFDLWGCLGPNPDSSDPWYGFHRFKEGYEGELVEFIGSYDLIINPVMYQVYKAANKMRWMFLKLRS